MRFVLRSLVSAIGVAAGVLAAADGGLAQDYPSRPVTIVVGFDAGGSVDRMARGLATFLPKHLGQPVIVDNRPGAGGQVGTTWFLAQPADGYTLMISPATPYIVNNIVVTGARYTLDDFTFINAQWTDFAFLAVPKDRPYKTLSELVDAIKTNPGKLSAGVTFGSIGHVSTVVLLEKLGLARDAVRLVTFDGGGPLRTALAGGQVDFSIVQAEGSETIADLIRPLAVYAREPLLGFDAPAINEALKPYNTEVPPLSGSVRTFIAPAGFKKEHPADFDKLVNAYKATLESQEYQDWLKQNQMAGDWVGPEKTTETIQSSYQILEQYKDLLK
jgi:putative tricarboxylic transport membrane protein